MFVVGSFVHFGTCEAENPCLCVTPRDNEGDAFIRASRLQSSALTSVECLTKLVMPMLNCSRIRVQMNDQNSLADSGSGANSRRDDLRPDAVAHGLFPRAPASWDRDLSDLAFVIDEPSGVATQQRPAEVILCKYHYVRTQLTHTRVQLFPRAGADSQHRQGIAAHGWGPSRRARAGYHFRARAG